MLNFTVKKNYFRSGKLKQQIKNFFLPTKKRLEILTFNQNDLQSSNQKSHGSKIFHPYLALSFFKRI